MTQLTTEDLDPVPPHPVVGPAVGGTYTCLYCHVGLEQLTNSEAQASAARSDGQFAVRRCASGAWHVVAADPDLD